MNIALFRDSVPQAFTKSSFILNPLKICTHIHFHYALTITTNIVVEDEMLIHASSFENSC